MRIATFNINGVNGRLPVLLAWLRQTRADIVCLQELQSPQEAFPREAIAATGFDAAIWHGQKSWNGVAILSRFPITETRRGLPGDKQDLQSRYIEAAIRGVLVGCVYLPNGNPAPGPKFDYKLEWIARFRQYSKSLLAAQVPCVLAGDFNIIPTEADVYAPARWIHDALFRPEVRKGFAHLLRDGWVDAVRCLHPDDRIYTFWKYWRNAFQRDAGVRIDHLLLSPQLAPWLRDAGVDRVVRSWEKASDHAPVWIDLKQPKGPRR